MKTVITYGTFDLLHHGHIELLRRAKALSQGGQLIVAVSTDELNWNIKRKKAHQPYEKRQENVMAIRYVDMVIPESEWKKQKKADIKKYSVDIFVMGDDWKGKFDELRKICRVDYLPRTPSISSSVLKGVVKDLSEVEDEMS